MADLPELRSREQIQGELIDSFLSRVEDVNDINVSAVINQFFSAISAQNFKSAAAVIAMIDASSIDRASGEALQRLATDRGVPILSGTSGSGTVTITDTTITKISSKVFVGQPAPVAGALVIYVDDASGFDATITDQLYIGRGTTNREGPLTYTTVAPIGNGAYWRIDLDPTTPTTKFHNTSETVIAAQGGIREIPIGTLVSTPEGGTTVSRFSTVESVLIADGETSVHDVAIISQALGAEGNVSRGAITEVTGLPFAASAVNDNAIVNATLPDDDDAIRTRVKQYEEAKHKGTEASIRIASLNVTAPDEQKTSTSADSVRLVDGTSILVFDDSTGYEPLVSGVGFETILDKAIGGEEELQLRQFPISIARTKTINTSPFDITNGQQLQVTIQGETTTHTFSDDNFAVPEFATTLELAASINGNADINFLATTSEGRDRLVLFPKDRTKNDIVVDALDGDDVNDVLGFSNIEHRTLLLYKNDILLQQDGIFATLSSKNKSEWSSSIVEGDTLRYRVDGTPEITLTLTNELFQAIDGVSTVSFFTEIAVWVAMFDSIMPGVDATLRGNIIEFTSTRGADDLSSVQITGGSLVSKIFSSTQDLFVSGQGSDYILNKNTGQIHLTDTAEFCDRYTAGSEVTRAFQNSGDIPDGPSTAGEMWWLIDGEALIVSSGIRAGNTVTIDKSPFVLPLLSPPLSDQTIVITMQDDLNANLGFEDVQQGDWLIVRAEAGETFDGWQGHWRVREVQKGRLLVEESANVVRPASTSGTLPTDRMIVVRSPAPLQYMSFAAGSLDVFAQSIRDQIEGVQVDVIGAHLRVSTLSRTQSKGETLIIAQDDGGVLTGFQAGMISSNIVSQHASLTTNDSESNMPSFTISTVTDEVTSSILSIPDYETIGGTRDGFIEVLPDHKEGAPYIAGIGTLTKAGLLSFSGTTNDNRRSFIRNFDDSNDKLTLLPKEYLLEDTTRLTAGDRFYLRDNFKFDAEDVLSLVIDGDDVNGVYNLPVTRLLTVNSASLPTLIDFSANDGESTLGLNNINTFQDFDFADFKVWRRATEILTDGTYSLKITNADFGPSGNTTMVGFAYPTNIDQTSLSHLITNSPSIGVTITLPVTTPRITFWDGSSTFTAEVDSTTGGRDRITYTWRTGSEPDFLATGADVNIGDIVIVDEFSDLTSANKGFTAKVVGVTANTFTVDRPTGVATTDNIAFASLTNSGGVLTITTESAHGLSFADKVGIWGTDVLIPSSLDSTATVTSIIDEFSFTVAAPTGSPSNKAIININGVEQTNTVSVVSNDHGLSIGDVINVTNTGVLDLEGNSVVREVLDDNSFTYIKDLSVNNFAITGVFNLQSFIPDTTYVQPVMCAARNSNQGEQTLFTSLPHLLEAGDVVEIGNMTIPWQNGGPDDDPRREKMYFTNDDDDLNALELGELPVEGQYFVRSNVRFPTRVGALTEPLVVQDGDGIWKVQIYARTASNLNAGDKVILGQGTFLDDGSSAENRIYTVNDIVGAGGNEFLIVEPDIVDPVTGVSGDWTINLAGSRPFWYFKVAGPFDFDAPASAIEASMSGWDVTDTFTAFADMTVVGNTTDANTAEDGGFVFTFLGFSAADIATLEHTPDSFRMISAGDISTPEIDANGLDITLTRAALRYTSSAGENHIEFLKFTDIPDSGNYLLEWPDSGETVDIPYDADAAAITLALNTNITLAGGGPFVVTGDHVDGFNIEITDATTYNNPFLIDATDTPPTLSAKLITSEAVQIVKAAAPTEVEVSSEVYNQIENAKVYTSTTITTTAPDEDFINPSDPTAHYLWGSYFTLEDSGGFVAVYFTDNSMGGKPEPTAGDLNPSCYRLITVNIIDPEATAEETINIIADALTLDASYSATASADYSILTITNTATGSFAIGRDGGFAITGGEFYTGLDGPVFTGTVGLPHNPYICFTDPALGVIPISITGTRIDIDIISAPAPLITEPHYILETDNNLLTVGLRPITKYDDFDIRLGAVLDNPNDRTTLPVIEFGGRSISQASTVVVDAEDSIGYTPDDLVEYNGLYYRSINGNDTDQPDISPASWELTEPIHEGKFVIKSVTALSFTYIVGHDWVDIFPTMPETTTISKFKTGGSIARALGDSGRLLAFGAIETTAQDVVDYAATDMADIISITLNGGTAGDIINTATFDIDSALNNYLYGTVTKIETVAGSQKIKLTVTDSAIAAPADREIPAGSIITVTLGNSLLYDVDSIYDGTYIVLESNPVNSFELIVQSTTYATETLSLAIDGTFIAHTPFLMLKDGENSVLFNDLSFPTVSPSFTVKKDWNLAPNIGEQLKLVAVNNDHLERFWNEFAVSGLSNVADIETSEYGRQLQLTSKTYGSAGSIHITGGNANSTIVALVGSGAEETSTGSLTIPIGLRVGLFKNQWIKVEQSVRIHKDLGLAETTEIAVGLTQIEIVSGPGSFQTQRTTTADEETKLKIERQGDFIAISRIKGTSLGLVAGAVEEGDWVRMSNQASPDFDFSFNYLAGARVLYRGFNWVNHEDVDAETVAPIPAIVWDIDTIYSLNDTISYDGNAYRSDDNDNQGFYPDDQNNNNWSLVWERQEWETANTGIYRVVRTFGDDTFWIENANAVEDVFILGDAANLAFYSYDSVMPGDTLVVAGEILDQVNIGRYLVLGDTTGDFPTSTSINIEPLVEPVDPDNFFLGTRFNQLNIEEAEPIVLWKKIQALAATSTSLTSITTDTPNLLGRLTDTNGAFLTAQGKLNFSTTPAFGIDSYKYYRGLLKEIHRIVYGDTLDSLDYPGIRGAGANIDITPAIVHRVTLSLSINIRTGSLFSSVAEAVKAAAAGYINRLGVGESVVLSEVIAAAMGVSGVHSVAIDFPQYNSLNDTIDIGVLEKAFVINPTTDISVIDIGDC